MNIEHNKILNNKYQLLKRIGSGGFSVVWLAEDIENNNEKYAIKIYSPQQGLNPDDIELFELEYKRLLDLSHAHIVETNGYFKVEESPCLILKYCSRGSLHQKIKDKKQLTEIDIAKLMVQIGSALNYLHSLPTPIYHLDLKPENILIDEDADNANTDKYILTDFGISNEVRSTLLRRSTIIAETFSYRSPERALNHNLSDRHDVFSFGVVLMECCRGFFDTKFSLADSVLNGYDLPKIEGYSSRLTDILYKIIELDPNDRPSALDIYSFGSHFLENKFWPKIEIANKTKMYNPIKGGNLYGNSIENSEKSNQTWYISAIVLIVLLSVVVFIYGFLKINNIANAVSSPKENRCQVLSNEINSLFKRGKFSSIENLETQISDLCPNNPGLSDTISLSKTCLLIMNTGSQSYDKGDYEEAKNQYEKFKNCGCSDDSLGVVKARLGLIPDKLNTKIIKNNSIKKINQATKSN